MPSMIKPKLVSASRAPFKPLMLTWVSPTSAVSTIVTPGVRLIKSAALWTPDLSSWSAVSTVIVPGTSWSDSSLCRAVTVIYSITDWAKISETGKSIINETNAINPLFKYFDMCNTSKLLNLFSQILELIIKNSLLNVISQFLILANLMVFILNAINCQ